jgi:IclR family KDG regulon transcriptional repressor
LPRFVSKGCKEFLLYRTLEVAHLETASRQDYFRIHSVKKALQILKLFTREQPYLRLTAIAEQTGIHKSTVHRLVRTLEEHGFLRWDPETGTYCLGLVLIELSDVVLSNLDIRKQARPHMEHLRVTTGQTVHLGVLQDGEVLYVDKVEGTGSIRLYSQVGRKVPSHCTALGKALLAFLPESSVAHIVGNGRSMQRYTQNTITQLPRLLEELKQVRILGYAADREEHEPLVHCVAAPIRDHSGSVIAAISMTMIGASIPKNVFEENAYLVKTAASNISSAVGYREPASP